MNGGNAAAVPPAPVNRFAVLRLRLFSSLLRTLRRPSLAFVTPPSRVARRTVCPRRRWYPTVCFSRRRRLVGTVATFLVRRRGLFPGARLLAFRPPHACALRGRRDGRAAGVNPACVAFQGAVSAAFAFDKTNYALMHDFFQVPFSKTRFRRSNGILLCRNYGSVQTPICFCASAQNYTTIYSYSYVRTIQYIAVGYIGKV